jgi:hypothetical protein
VIGGIISSTSATLIALPVLYTVFFGRGKCPEQIKLSSRPDTDEGMDETINEDLGIAT